MVSVVIEVALAEEEIVVMAEDRLYIKPFVVTVVITVRYLFRPTGEKPVYCNDCFGGKKAEKNVVVLVDAHQKRVQRTCEGSKSEKPVNDDTRKLLMEVISKLDRLTGIMENINQVKKLL